MYIHPALHMNREYNLNFSRHDKFVEISTNRFLQHGFGSTSKQGLALRLSSKHSATDVALSELLLTFTDEHVLMLR